MGTVKNMYISANVNANECGFQKLEIHKWSVIGSFFLLAALVKVLYYTLEFGHHSFSEIALFLWHPRTPL